MTSKEQNPKIPIILTTTPTKALAKQIEDELKRDVPKEEDENCLQTIIPQQ